MRDGNLIEDDYDKVQRTVDNLDTNTLHLNIVDFLTQVADTNDLTSIQSIKLKLMTKDLPLYNMNLHLPGLKELDLESSNIHSLRELGANMQRLHVLRLGRCKLSSLDGILSFGNLIEFSAPENVITDIGLLGYLPKIMIIDISRNHIKHYDKLSFLQNCDSLKELFFQGNPGCKYLNYRANVRKLLPQLELLDGKSIHGSEIIEENGTEDKADGIRVRKIPLGLSSCGRNMSMILANLSRVQPEQEDFEDLHKLFKLEKLHNPKNLLKAAEKWRVDFKNILNKRI
ncbi:leucine-rich repeat-containing protein 56 isoform X2 [Rhodnius prolixus]|uniref:leucine-rich repeat-containing protein 56 isoform X2 n=1 Tax=Rhodnius prolixus TaxID=13249 RepID=UPI003D18938D